MTNKSRIGLFFGGKSVEHEVSLRSMKSVAEALNKDLYEPVFFAVSKAGRFYKAENINVFDEVLSVDDALVSLEEISIDSIQKHSLCSVFSTMHGGLGESGAFQGLFEILQIPYVGPKVLGSAIATDKDVTKRLLDQASIPVTPWYTIKQKEELEHIKDKLKYPCFVKAASLGSSVGVYKCKHLSEVEIAVENVLKLDLKVLIEEGIEGREIEVAVLGGPIMKASQSGEVIPHHEFYSYEAKYLDDNGATLCYPAKNIDHEAFKAIAIKVCQVLEIDGMARVDFFVTGTGSFYVNEVNTLPGFTSISMYPKLFEISSIDYSTLITQLIEHSIERAKKNDLLQKTLYDNLVVTDLN